MYIANYRINTGKVFFQKGDEVVGLSTESIERLIKIGALSSVGGANTSIDVVPQNKDDTVGVEKHDADTMFLKMLGEQKKNDLIEYAVNLNLDINERMNMKEIIDVILKQCEVSGYDFDALTENQLSRLADLLEVDVKDKDNDSVIKAIIMVFEKENE